MQPSKPQKLGYISFLFLLLNPNPNSFTQLMCLTTIMAIGCIKRNDNKKDKLTT
uniref:Uncharacterized protein n=1 Tax=Rhizophora mucronata TaxID=61149 RepID=A0A2P2PNP0_RHIMU